MVTKTVVRVSADGVVMSAVAAVAPNDENRNNHQPPKNKDVGSEDENAAARKSVEKHQLDGIANNQVNVDNIITTHFTKTKDENKSMGTRRSSKQKRPLVLYDDVDEDADSDKKKRHRKQGKKFIDLTGVPNQQPILKLKHDGKKDDFSSKYLGVCWVKSGNKWKAEIRIDGKQRQVGSYDNEEDAAIDYARAVFKYNGGSDGIERLEAKQSRKASQEKIDLTGVPNQQPILKLKHDGKTGALSSKYLGVSWVKSGNKWRAEIRIDGKHHYIGYYVNEEDAAIDYARAVHKYNGGSDGIERLKAKQSRKASQEKLDLTGVPMQVPIMKPNGKGSSTSKYKGVSFNKASNKWQAHISIDGNGKQRHVGFYVNEEDAAIDYARAVHKYKGGNAEVKRQDVAQQQQLFNLIKIPAIPPAGYDPINEGSISASAFKLEEYEI